MARTRRSASVEASASRANAIKGVFAGVCAAAVWIAVTRYLPADWTWPSEEERDRIVLIGGGGLLALCAFRCGAAGFHGIRWVRARRWERMLGDPSSAHLVPPLREHVKSVTRASELRLRVTAAIAALVSIGLAVAIVRYNISWSDTAEDDQSGPVMIAGFAGWVAVKSWRSAGRRRLARRIEAISVAGHGNAEPEEQTSGAAPSSNIPELNVTFALRGEAAAARPGLRAASGGRPSHVLYLRLFDNEAGTTHFLTGPWTRRGYVHLLRSADQVTPEEVDEARDAGSIESMFITSAAELDEALERQATGRHDPPMPDGIVARWRWIRDEQRGRYPVRALLCHGSFWKAALDLLLPRMDHVVLDLTGYRRERTGTRYELQRLIDTYPIEMVSIIGGAGCDRQFLTAQIKWAWRQMAAGSPNEGSGSRTISVRLPSMTARAA